MDVLPPDPTPTGSHPVSSRGPELGRDRQGDGSELQDPHRTQPESLGDSGGSEGEGRPQEVSSPSGYSYAGRLDPVVEVVIYQIEEGDLLRVPLYDGGMATVKVTKITPSYPPGRTQIWADIVND